MVDLELAVDAAEGAVLAGPSLAPLLRPENGAEGRAGGDVEVGNDVLRGLVEVVAPGPGADAHGQLFAVEEVGRVRVVRDAQDAVAPGEGEPGGEEGDALRREGHLTGAHVVLEGHRIVDVDAPRSRDAADLFHVDRRPKGVRRGLLRVVSEAVASLKGRRVRLRVGGDDGVVVADVPKHANRHGVPVLHEVAVGIDAHHKSLVPVELLRVGPGDRRTFRELPEFAGDPHPPLGHRRADRMPRARHVQR
mmetsp:Transcript_34301/g.110152  ORF Transcript_34301/g.110152 Transcript_34301/m.110152 type:complete len:249 (-) Transcript_34301:609-1355(-)